jgi:hypothetical protein
MSYKYEASMYSGTNYIVTRQKVDSLEPESEPEETFNVSLQNYTFEGLEGYPEVISNYYIDEETSDSICYFASIVYEKIEYVDDNYNPYDYDPDPKYLIYRDELEPEQIEKCIKVIQTLSETFYENTTHWKHFLPSLTKLKLSDAKQMPELKMIVTSMEELIEHFSN